MKKYFVVYNEYLAMGIHYVTGERYYKFTNEQGQRSYSFTNTDKVQETYKLLMDLHYENMDK
ncbi:hypothetical protein [Clostridium butyricum]|uniref:hypothetical protein n=1 Tax=Clostridium butyricum TaxID=1492 RepID=UPI00189E7A1D|nr:hypothetical protein [Clostridium butyricum]MDB2151195.1 hypothetical protein [Clostridium butyricum]MDU3584102.1 hypothetical protein [Clostridium butyricum]MDU3595599.1 hypothetical protein [Clostridium butyricum]